MSGIILFSIWAYEQSHLKTVLYDRAEWFQRGVITVHWGNNTHLERKIRAWIDITWWFTTCRQRSAYSVRLPAFLSDYIFFLYILKWSDWRLCTKELLQVEVFVCSLMPHHTSVEIFFEIFLLSSKYLQQKCFLFTYKDKHERGGFGLLLSFENFLGSLSMLTISLS